MTKLFGRVAKVEPPGLHYLPPWPLGKVERVRTGLVRRLEVGFRTVLGKPVPFGMAYEWNVRHTAGGYERRPEEALMLTGDENMLEVNFVVEWRVKDPVAFTTGISWPERVVRAVAESVVREVAARTSMEGVLTARRKEFEAEAKRILQAILDGMGAGVEVLAVALQDVHPPLEVVGAFREVASALEDRARAINEAEAFKNERLPKARGEAVKILTLAKGEAERMVEVAKGRADGFRWLLLGYRASPPAMRIRLRLEAFERALAGKRKVVVGTEGNKRLFIGEGPQGLLSLLGEGGGE